MFYHSSLFASPFSQRANYKLLFAFLAVVFSLWLMFHSGIGVTIFFVFLAVCIFSIVERGKGLDTSDSIGTNFKRSQCVDGGQFSLNANRKIANTHSKIVIDGGNFKVRPGK